MSGPCRSLVENSAGPSLRTYALDLTVYETVNVASTKWRSQGKAGKVTELIFEACPRQLIRVDQSLADEAAVVSADCGLTAYDAAYVAAAARHSLQLISIDIADLVDPGHAIDPETALARLG